METCKALNPSLRFTAKMALGGLVLAALSACPNAGDATATTAETLEQGLSCPAGMMKAGDGAEMKIQASEAAQVGQTVSYELNGSALCSGAQKVEWSVPGAKTTAMKAGSVSALYKAPGDYYVAAKLVDSSADAQQILVAQTLVMGEQIQFSGPQIATVYGINTFSLTSPSGGDFSSIVWNFGDGETQTTTSASVTHEYQAVGEYTIQVTATETSGVITTFEHLVTVIEGSDELFCATQLTVSAPSETQVGVNNTLSVFMPTCMRTYLTGVQWTLGDATSASGETINKIYSAAGDYSVRVTITLRHPVIQTIRINRRIQVNAAPVDNNKCPTAGQTRTTVGAAYNESEACGIRGRKTVSYQDRKNESCERVEDILDWVTTSTVKEKLSEGPCEGQACALPGAVPAGTAGVEVIGGVAYLLDGRMITSYSNSNPANTCEQNRETRICTNGVLSGNSTSIHYQCQSGCGEFGPHGTVKLGIQVGTRQVPVTCGFGEQGVFDVFNEIEDRACSNGNVGSSNLRLGDLVSKGLCPTYSYQPTGQFTACTANCGGTQQMIFECRSASGERVGSERCAGQTPPVQSRVCDGNPEAVRRVESASQAQQEPSQLKCPKNQIGVILNNRNAITKMTYACINHAVGVESTVVEYTPWVEERYCRDYVAHRCSDDSLNNTDAHGRYLWMKKCAPHNAAIAEFLENFDNVSNGSFGIDSNGRSLYPTFMNAASNPERLWKAPTRESAACNIPESVYVAAVCVSSCAIPQEQILAQMNAAKKTSAVEFVKALTEKYERVATLSKNSSISSRELKNSKVEQWVTELTNTEQPVLVFTMESGKTLSITPNHPVLRPDGSMDTAEHFKAGDALVALGGIADPIVSIEPISYYGKVYNLFVQSAVPQENIVVTNGYLNGTAFFQNEGAGHLNKTLLRKKLTKGIFKK